MALDAAVVNAACPVAAAAAAVVLDDDDDNDVDYNNNHHGDSLVYTIFWKYKHDNGTYKKLRNELQIL